MDCDVGGDRLSRDVGGAGPPPAGCHVTWEVTSPGPQALSPPGGTRLRRAGYEDGLGRSLSWPNFARRPSLPEHLVLPMSEMTVYGAVYLVAHYSVALATVHYFLQLL